MLPIKIGKIRCKIPTSWDEITLEQYLEFHKLGEQPEMLDVLEVITGVSSLIWAKVDVEKINNILLYRDGKEWRSHLDWLSEPQEFEKLGIKPWFNVGDYAYRVPDDLSECTLAQHITVSRIVRESDDPVLRMHEVLAVFFQPIIEDRDYNESRALEMAPMFMRCKFVECYPIASFFFQRAGGYGHPLPKLVRNFLPMNLVRVLINLMRLV